MSAPRLLVTIDVERDYGPDWRTQPTVTYRGVLEGIAARLAPCFASRGVRPTYLVSGEVLLDPQACAVLRGQVDCELGTHLHAEYVAPAPLAGWCDPAVPIRAMQGDLPPDVERAKLATLTELFRQQFGTLPRAFRAGRFGAGRHTAKLLAELGYLVDSSVLPHQVLTNPQGQPQPDYRGLPERPYFVGPAGDLWQPGDGGLLEVPVTMLAGSRWPRPWYAPRDQLLAMVREVLAEPEQDGSREAGHRRPLVLMFHNVEAVAAASPYPQTASEVQRWLDDLQAMLDLALALGAEPCTLTELYRSYTHAKVLGPRQAEPVTPERRAVRLPAALVDGAIDRHGAQPWFKHSFHDRPERWDLVSAYAWIARNVKLDSPVLDTGCGVGLNLAWLAQEGFTSLWGCDVDPKAIAAGREIAAAAALPLHLWVGDALQAQGAPLQKYAVIAALNWTHLLSGFSLEAFFDRWLPWLRDDGVLVFDAIDARFAEHPKHRYLTSDWDKPEGARRPSEYQSRFSDAELWSALRSRGLIAAAVIEEPQTIPKRVIVARRASQPQALPKILVIVDAPGWAHDRKTDNLLRCLSDRFTFEKRFQADVKPSDLDAADLIVVYYWRQFGGMPQVAAALARNRSKLLLGVCSHAELEGDQRPAAVAALRSARAVFAHNPRLHAEVEALRGGAVFYTPNGVDTAFFSPLPSPSPSQPGRPLRVGWAGSLTNHGPELRGFHDIIVPATAQPGIELVTAIAEQHHRDAAEMRSFYRSLDVYVCASRHEGTPNPCLEAAACGIPLVTTPVGNMPELVRDGVHGFLIERDARDLALKLAVLRDQPTLRARMGERLRREILAWDWRHQAERFAAMFDTVLAPTPHLAAEPKRPPVSFCIITHGRRPETLTRTIRTIQAQGVPDLDIVIAGRWHDAPGVRWIRAEAEADQGRLGAMRNRAVAAARHRLIAILDDDILLTPGWYAALCAHATPFDILTSQLRVPDGGRYWDHCTVGGPQGHRLLEPDEHDDFVYMTGGGAWVMTAPVAAAVRWDEERGFYENEDVAFARACQAAGYQISHEPKMVAVHADPSYTTVGRAVVKRSLGISATKLAQFGATLTHDKLIAAASTFCARGLIAEAADCVRGSLWARPDDPVVKATWQTLQNGYHGGLAEMRWFPAGDPELLACG